MLWKLGDETLNPNSQPPEPKTMSVIKTLQKTYGGQWLYIKATRKGEAVWISSIGKMARRSARNERIAVK